MQVYSFDLKEKVRDLRRQGLSLGDICNKTNVPRTTIRGWIKSISLTHTQRQALRQRTLSRLQSGRIRTQELRKKEKQQKETDLIYKGMQDIGVLSKRDLFIAGVALYWGEGFKNKYEHRLGFCNSDPAMVKFYLNWLSLLGIKKEEITLRITINNTYRDRVEEIEKYWSEFLDIPSKQFTKPFFQKTVWKKQFNKDTYKGVVRVHVKNYLDLLLKMRGWIEGLKMIK